MLSSSKLCDYKFVSQVYFRGSIILLKRNRWLGTYSLHCTHQELFKWYTEQSSACWSVSSFGGCLHFWGEEAGLHSAFQLWQELIFSEDRMAVFYRLDPNCRIYKC